jgi:hypothetical protein
MFYGIEIAAAVGNQAGYGELEHHATIRRAAIDRDCRRGRQSGPGRLGD